MEWGVGAPPPPLFILTSKPLKCFQCHQIVLYEAASHTRFSISHVRGVLFVAGWVSAEGQQQTWFVRVARAERGTFIHQEEVQCNQGSKCKVDKWLITSRSEMIHHFLKLSSLKHCTWTYISVSYSRWSCLLQYGPTVPAVKFFLSMKNAFYILQLFSLLNTKKI